MPSFGSLSSAVVFTVIVNETGDWLPPGVSVLSTVTVAVEGEASTQFTGFVKARVNVKGPVTTPSSSTGTVTVWVVWPGLKVSVPDGVRVVDAGLRRAVGRGVVDRRGADG